MRVVVIRHHNEDYPGLIEEAFRARGAELITHLFLNGGETAVAGRSRSRGTARRDAVGE